MRPKVVLALPLYRRRLSAVMTENAMLTDFGIGVSERQDFDEQRARLRASVGDVAWVAWWLDNFIDHRKTINQTRTSYGLKHLAEKFHPDGYITNGVFIAAGLIVGFKHKRIEGTPNVAFAMSERSIQAARQRAKEIGR